MSKQQKTSEELIKAIKKMNKTARELFAQRAGYLSSVDYIAALSIPKKSISHSKNYKNFKATVHVVDILDVSGSMGPLFTNKGSDSKLDAALKAINIGIKELAKEKLVNYTYSLTTFSTSKNIKFLVNQANPIEVAPITANADGGTALYDAIGLTLQKLASIKNREDKVLVNIYTDGEENSSVKFTKKQISDLIEKEQKFGFTVTFIGTIEDTKTAVKDLKIDKSNTLSYDGTAKGLSKTMSATSSMRSVYASSVSKGEDVTVGFYKTLNNE